MSDSIAEALERQATLRAELALLDQYIELHSRLFGKGEATARREAPTKMRRSRSANDPKLVVAETTDILREANEPLTRGELLAALSRRGVEIQSADKGKYIGTVLWRNPDVFINVEGKGYWLKDRPLPDFDALFK